MLHALVDASSRLACCGQRSRPRRLTFTARASASSTASTSARAQSEDSCIYKAVLSYDGTAYCGFQKQPNGDTVQERLERALVRIFGTDRLRLYLFPAGRTDTGVHATGQVVSFNAPPYSRGIDALALSMNSLLPDDIRVASVAVAPPGFSARFSCVAKEYHYCVVTGIVSNPFRRLFAFYTHHALDWDAMEEAAIAFEGVHNFSAFANLNGSIPVERDPVRLVRKCRLVRTEEGFRIEVEGSGFLYKQVRNMVGAILRIGRGLDKPGAIAKSLRTGARPFALKAAPAHGLYLHRVFYPEDGDLPEGYRAYGEKVLGHQVLRATTAPGDFIPWEWKWSSHGPPDLRLGSEPTTAAKAVAAAVRAGKGGLGDGAVSTGPTAGEGARAGVGGGSARATVETVKEGAAPRREP